MTVNLHGTVWILEIQGGAIDSLFITDLVMFNVYTY